MTTTWEIRCDAPECSNTLETNAVERHPMMHYPLPTYLTLVSHSAKERHFCSLLCLKRYVDMRMRKWRGDD